MSKKQKQSTINPLVVISSQPLPLLPEIWLDILEVCSLSPSIEVPEPVIFDEDFFTNGQKQIEPKFISTQFSLASTCTSLRELYISLPIEKRNPLALENQIALINGNAQRRVNQVLEIMSRGMRKAKEKLAIKYNVKIGWDLYVESNELNI